MNNYLRSFRTGNKRTIARVISEIENGNIELLEQLYPFTGHAYYVGITGPPGAGKSTLVNVIAKHLLTRGKRIGIVAVDPSSPFSGGALLGDRIRMNDLALNDKVFIRSMATRGSLGGLAEKTKDVVLVLDAAGMDFIIIETIGVGQVELDVAQVGDTTIVVMVPESGDSIQTMKAGLLEISDIMVVNKGDRDGAERILTELKFAFDLKEPKNGWTCPIIRTVATRNEGIDELVGSLLDHRKYLQTSGRYAEERKIKAANYFLGLISSNISSQIHSRISADRLQNYINDIYERRINPYKAATEIVMRVMNTPIKNKKDQMVKRRGEVL
ncbi:hypothetical protein A2Y85_06540 [candidate division WOR-3 bacterium RBG_13_43_14]|uniref:AAA+ ATPase domain-containing protein n=1 Tax=candidate division WOR-3 bacterium RBG_13_43_14 TaxID=1802590 RepID=A0A1F4U2E0_UNCW3|nr:MAG: hypothetical protein A2Y85_06540 [candidate division WOR-3 bacterium RBG_13_43_14]